MKGLEECRIGRTKMDEDTMSMEIPLPPFMQNGSLALHQQDEAGDAEPEQQKHGSLINLKPKLSLLNGVTIIVGSIIGSGIFVSPRGVFQNTGSPGLSLIVWFGCGVFSMIGSYCYAELGCAIVRSGADYAYIYEAFGPLLAFLRLWVEAMIVRPCSQAIVALTFAYYVIEPAFSQCSQPDLPLQFLSAACISKYNHYLLLQRSRS